MANRLAQSTSPYLLQHADNPVDWQEWSPQALAEAVERDVPIFLSVGYSACHWCHVMAHESFSDPAVAALINADFVAIKVDREERPDLDAVYMDATVGLTGQGGWPMSVWLTPSGTPFHAGTYFPPEPRHGMPSFGEVLTAVSTAWRERRSEVLDGAARIGAELAGRARTPPGGAPRDTDVEAAIGALSRDFDARAGGFGGAPKFPPSMVLAGLVAAAAGDTPAAESAWQMASTTLRAMAAGGIHDQLGGGFARYSTDTGWVVPHFEKMLYDNALLVPAYLRAGLEASRRGEDAAPYERVVDQTIGWALETLRTPQGAFASALDADSATAEGRVEEGAYYLWTPEELIIHLGAVDGAWLAEVLGITVAGTFEHGRSVAQCRTAPPDRARCDALRATLAAVRAQRPAPDRNDTVITAWNGWMIAALAEAAMVGGRDDWLAAASRAAEHLWVVHRVDGRLRRASRGDRVSAAMGVAEDHAALAQGCDLLAQATGDPRWLHRAGEMLGLLERHFAADDGGVYDTADDAERLYLRPRDPAEGATPSGTTAALLAYRLHARLTGDPRWQHRADTLAAGVAPLLRAAPRAAGWPLLDAVVQRSGGAAEIAVIGQGALAVELTRTAWRLAPPGSTVVAAPRPTPGFAVLTDRGTVRGLPTAHVCRGSTCQRPVSTVEELARQLGR